MPRALIIGGGIAGPAVATLLATRGWEATVLEARPTPYAYEGLFLNVAINGRRVLRALDVEDRLLEQAHPAGWSVLWSGRGRRLGAVPNGPAGRPDEGGVIVRRGWLQQVLRERAVAAGVVIEDGWELARLDLNSARAAARAELDSGGRVRLGGDGVTAHSADGRREEGDIVIGADGIGSRVRSVIAPTVRPVFTGLLGTGGYAAVPDLAPTPGEQHFVFGARSFFGYLVSTAGVVHWFANLTASDPPPEWTEEDDSGSLLDRLRTLHADDPDPVPRILRRTSGPVGAYPIFRLPPVPTWHRGRAVLIGDAVHATSPSAGQGASLALEDAVVLAACLGDRPYDPSAAFTAYETARRDRVERVLRYADAIDRQKRIPSSRVGLALRDALLPLFLRRVAKDTRQDWVFDADLSDSLVSRATTESDNSDLPQAPRMRGNGGDDERGERRAGERAVRHPARAGRGESGRRGR